MEGVCMEGVFTEGTHTPTEISTGCDCIFVLVSMTCMKHVDLWCH